MEYLRQVGEYDLEVEAMNLDAETISNKVVKMGKGSDSAFGDDSILETVRANVLKKPFTKTELENLLNESLKGMDAIAMQQALLSEYHTEADARLQADVQEMEHKYAELINNIPFEKKILKLSGEAKDEAIKGREKELISAMEAQLKMLTIKAGNRRQYLEKIFRFFYIGKYLQYPIDSFTGGNELIPAVFIGCTIDRKKKNPFAPSLIKLRFAIANSSKYFAIPASYSEDIMAIIGASADIVQPDKAALLQQWEHYTQQNHSDRKIRHIITGNLLQAFSDYKGKLVSYTTIDGKTVKGILMPENWDAGEQVQDKVVVPIIKALPLIKSLVNNNHILTNTGLSIFRQGEHYRIIVSAARAKGGDVYLDRQLLELVDNNNFDKVSDKMVATLQADHIQKFIEILQQNHSCAVSVNAAQFREIEKNVQRYSSRRQIELPPAMEDEQPDNTISLLELEAEALALELELLAA